MQDQIKELLMSFPKQVVDAIKASKIKIEDASKVENIVLTGMGGSAVAGNILQEIVSLRIPFTVNKGYELPNFVNSKSLVIVVSYSGNTEETINALQSARRKNSNIVVITSGGKIAEIARKYEIPIIKMPKGFVPRFTVIYQMFAVLHLLHTSGFIKLKKQDIEESVRMLKKDYSKTALELGKKLRDKVILIYTSPKLKGIGLYWKQAFNENAKIQSFNASFPELNHNEMNAFVKNSSNYHVIILRDEKEGMRINKRIDLTKKILKNCKVQISDIVLKGESALAKACSAIALGATVSSELADLIDVDAVKVELIEEFKQQL